MGWSSPTKYQGYLKSIFRQPCFIFIEELYAMNLDAVNPELESKINDLVCEAYNKPFFRTRKVIKRSI